MKKRKPMVLYTVYDNKTDFPIITAASAKSAPMLWEYRLGVFTAQYLAQVLEIRDGLL